MISDNDENLESEILLKITKVNKKNNKDKELMQEYLETVYKCVLKFDCIIIFEQLTQQSLEIINSNIIPSNQILNLQYKTCLINTMQYKIKTNLN